MRQLVLAGGGHSHVEVLRQFGRRPLAGVEIMLISPHRHTPYSGMLPGLVAGHYTWDECHIDVAGLCGFARAKFFPDRVSGIDAYKQRLQCDSGVERSFDLLSLDVGSKPPIAAIEGAGSRGLSVRPVETFLHQWQRVAELAKSRPQRILVVGGGAGGIELALAMQHRTDRAAGTSASPSSFCVVTDADEILPGHAPSVRRRLQRMLRERGIVLLTRSRVAAVEDAKARLGDGTAIPADHTIWATGAAAPGWLRDTGLALDAQGFVLVNETLQSVSHPEIFASGDVATMAKHPRPKSGVYAVRQGPPLAQNLRRALTGAKLGPYFPQPVALSLISTGNKYAVASWGKVSFEGAWVWRWKDRIDRRFMERYRVG